MSQEKKSLEFFGKNNVIWMIAGAVLGAHAFISLFNKTGLLRIRISRILAAVLMIVVLFAIYTLSKANESLAKMVSTKTRG